MSNANSIVNFWRDDWLTMNQRIGEMFNGTDTFPRVWARARQHRLMGTTDYGFDRKSQEVELGYSFYSKREDDLMRYRGISLEGKKLNAMNDKHINSGRSVGVSLYQTDIYDNHFYGDYVLRVNQWRSGR